MNPVPVPLNPVPVPLNPVPVPLNPVPLNLNPINLNDLKNEIISVPADSPVLLYIGVGTASATRSTHPLPLEHYHQFPPFLQDMRNKVPNLHVFLLLLDPYQENPPRVAMDYNLSDKYQSGCHYQNAHNQPMQAFVYRLSVYTDPDVNPPVNGLNITGMLRDLNEFAKTQRISLVYHDFSGRNVALLAEYFDHENASHLDQIIYGLSAREDHGCFFDLTQPSAYFPYYVDPYYVENKGRPLVKMFNYYKQIVNQSYDDTELQVYPPEMREWAHIQKNQIVNKVRTHFKTVNLSLMRQVRKLMLSEAGPSEAGPSEAAELDLYSLNELPKLYRDMFRDLFNEKNYDLLYELLFNYSASELDIIAKLNKLEMTGEELLTFITLNEDPYKWYDVVKDLI